MKTFSNFVNESKTTQNNRLDENLSSIVKDLWSDDDPYTSTAFGAETYRYLLDTNENMTHFSDIVGILSGIVQGMKTAAKQTKSDDSRMKALLNDLDKILQKQAV
jgi:hypothetical protein